MNLIVKQLEYYIADSKFSEKGLPEDYYKAFAFIIENCSEKTSREILVNLPPITQGAKSLIEQFIEDLSNSPSNISMEDYSIFRNFILTSNFDKNNGFCIDSQKIKIFLDQYESKQIKLYADSLKTPAKDLDLSSPIDITIILQELEKMTM